MASPPSPGKGVINSVFKGTIPSLPRRILFNFEETAGDHAAASCLLCFVLLFWGVLLILDPFGDSCVWGGGI